ncbi:MAG: aquaporin [Balneolaceae bacterium]
MPKFFTEFIGTFLITIVAGISANPFAIGLLLAAMIYIAIDFSVPHFNPAVSMAALMTGDITLNEFTSYLSAQIPGAFTGGLFVWWLSGTGFVSEPAQSTGAFEFITIEVLFSFLFVWVFLAMIYPSRRRNPVFGLVIGLTLTGCYMITEPLSGPGLNPVMSSSFVFFDWINNGYSYYYLPVYILAPLVGGLGAAFANKKMNIE